MPRAAALLRGKDETMMPAAAEGGTIERGRNCACQEPSMRFLLEGHGGVLQTIEQTVRCFATIMGDTKTSHR